MPKPYELTSLELEPTAEVLRLCGEFPDIEALSFGDGEFLIREDESTLDIFIVIQGGLVVEQASAAPGAAPIPLACIAPDPAHVAILGEMAYLGAQRRAASVRASGRTHTLRLQPRHIDAILESYPMLTRVICQQFSRRLQDTDRNLRALQSRFALNPAQRLGNPGEVLFSAGEPARALFQLVTGRIRLDGPDGSRSLGPEDLPQGLLEPEPFLAGREQRVTAVVEDLSFLTVIDAQHREAVVRCFPELALNLLAARA